MAGLHAVATGTPPSLNLQLAQPSLSLPLSFVYIFRAALLAPVPCSAHDLVRSFLSSLPFVFSSRDSPARMDGADGLSSKVVRYFYLKQVTSYTSTSAMVLLLHDFCKHTPASCLFVLSFPC